MHGTFYMPDTPKICNRLDIPLGPNALHLVRQVKGLYHSKFATAVFAAVDARVGYNLDTFTADTNINPAQNVDLINIGTV